MRHPPLRHLDAVLRRRVVHLTFFLTRRCNARCAFCFHRGGPGGELDADRIARISRSAAPLLWLAFSGGEIFLRDDLPRLVAGAARASRAAIVLLPTNGLLPERIRDAVAEILAACPRSTVVVKVSVDGPPALHDRLRGIPGAFERAAATLSLLEELAARHQNLESGVNTVCCAENQHALDETAAVVAALPGVGTHTVSLVRGQIPDPTLGRVDPDRYLRAAELLAKGSREGTAPRYRFRGARLKAAQDVLQRRLIHETVLARRQLLPCLAGRLNLVVDEAGDLYPCEEFSMRMGNVLDHGCDLARAAAAPGARAVIDRIRGGGCWCTHECFMMTNILFSPRTWPGLLVEYLRHSG